MAIAIAVLFIAVLVLAGMLTETRDAFRTLEGETAKCRQELARLKQEMSSTHARLLDGLWTRAQTEVDKQIEATRARFRATQR